MQSFVTKNTVSERTFNALKRISKKLKVDSPFMRYWYVAMLASMAYCYYEFTSALLIVVYDPWSTEPPEDQTAILAMACLYIADYVLNRFFIQNAPHSRAHRVINIISAIPYEIYSMAVPSSAHVRVVFRGLHALKLFTLPSMFRTDAPDVVDVHYIMFYYRWLPNVRMVFWSLFMLHTATIWKMLAANNFHEEYLTSMLWVWVLLTSAPLSVDPNTTAETALAGFLMLASMMIQGYAVGAVTNVLFSFNVKEENRTQIMVTLEMLRHYGIPRAMQEEVLSFQYHILEDTSLHTQFGPSLERLPPSMLAQIKLFVKVSILDKAAFFDNAPAECKMRLAQSLQQLVVDPDTMIIKAGDTGVSMFFMLHGLADVTLASGLCVATIRRGDFFGELALVSEDCKRMATVCSLTYCDLLELQKFDFDEAISEFREFATKIEERRKELMKNKAPPAAAAAPIPPPSLDVSSISHGPLIQKSMLLKSNGAMFNSNEQSPDEGHVRMFGIDGTVRLVPNTQNNSPNRKSLLGGSQQSIHTLFTRKSLDSNQPNEAATTDRIILDTSERSPAERSLGRRSVDPSLNSSTGRDKTNPSNPTNPTNPLQSVQILTSSNARTDTNSDTSDNVSQKTEHSLVTASESPHSSAARSAKTVILAPGNHGADSGERSSDTSSHKSAVSKRSVDAHRAPESNHLLDVGTHPMLNTIDSATENSIQTPNSRIEDIGLHLGDETEVPPRRLHSFDLDFENVPRAATIVETENEVAYTAATNSQESQRILYEVMKRVGVLEKQAQSVIGTLQSITNNMSPDGFRKSPLWHRTSLTPAEQYYGKRVSLT